MLRSFSFVFVLFEVTDGLELTQNTNKIMKYRQISGNSSLLPDGLCTQRHYDTFISFGSFTSVLRNNHYSYT